jgi:hypothetical protein
VKQWKIAISLAIAAAIAAPFVFGTWNEPLSIVVPLTEDERERYANFVDNDCQKLSENDSAACWLMTERLRQGGIAKEVSLTQYWAENAAAVLAAFVSVFGLTFLLPALVRRYWRWLNT